MAHTLCAIAFRLVPHPDDGANPLAPSVRHQKWGDGANVAGAQPSKLPVLVP